MQTSVRPRLRIRAPSESFERDVPLVAVERGGFVGSLHRGTAVVARPDGNPIVELGDGSQPVFLRSAAKPFQAMPVLITGAAERFALSDRELAVLCASHSAEAQHTDTILDLLGRAGLAEGSLRCGVHPPLHEATARERMKSGVDPSPVCNNCSGAHTGMLLACVAAGWPLDTYGAPDHPLQVLTREIVAAFSGFALDTVRFAVDNCAVPTFRVPAVGAARAFARLASARSVAADLRECASRVVRAMTSHPEMVAGEDRFDTRLMGVTETTVVSKGGAEGFQGIGVIPDQVGIAIKITDGNPRAIPPVAMALLRILNVLSEQAENALANYAQPDVRNHQGDLVGRLIPLLELEPSS